MRPATIGARAADKLSAGMGCWAFIGLQTLVYAFWIGWNHYAPTPWRFDSQDLLILNLSIGIFGNYAFSILLMSQNRQAKRDHQLLVDTHTKLLQDLKEHTGLRPASEVQHARI